MTGILALPGGGTETPPDEADKWPMDQISLEGAHTSSPISGVTAEEDRDTRKLKLEMEKEEKLVWGISFPGDSGNF